ncbi:hypothetical protein FIBSPDRAFT_900285 [Athelia psychrophila]|uniref:Uncharacterized protein n=1 Tax=Athelia psychrophila TaxID=1759441 RepID=A0A165YL79_9AGAM|nr:hypothetical protein FIBSPDRAFT_900285 [Fibularhizoctonia sp. CBS 109695]
MGTVGIVLDSAFRVVPLSFRFCISSFYPHVPSPPCSSTTTQGPGHSAMALGLSYFLVAAVRGLLNATRRPPSSPPRITCSHVPAPMCTHAQAPLMCTLASTTRTSANPMCTLPYAHTRPHAHTRTGPRPPGPCTRYRTGPRPPGPCTRYRTPSSPMLPHTRTLQCTSPPRIQSPALIAMPVASSAAPPSLIRTAKSGIALTAFTPCPLPATRRRLQPICARWSAPAHPASNPTLPTHALAAGSPAQPARAAVHLPAAAPAQPGQASSLACSTHASPARDA